VAQDLPLNDNDYVQQTPLFYTAKYNIGTEVGKILIDAGCDPNHKDANGQTALFYAAGEGKVEMCRLLADKGANLLATDKNKERAMHYAKRGGHRPVLDFLNSFARQDHRKAKEEKRMQESRVESRRQESSQNTVERRRKK
jgi:ankyrin repeat protein